MAVYTEVGPGALAAFLADYDLGPALSLAPIAEGIENSNYRLSTPRGAYVLTLFERRVDPAELPWFLGLMRHLAARGVACPQPVPGRDGAALRGLAGRPAAICTFLPGDWPRGGEAALTPARCAAVGTALAALHEAGRGYAPGRRNGLGPPAWGPLLARCAETGADPALCAELEGHLGRVLGAWPAEGDLPRGHVHADLFPDNVFFDGAGDGGAGERLTGIIDFYFACTDHLAYDLAVALSAWGFDAAAGRLDPARAGAMLAAYEAARPLRRAEREALPVLLAGAALRFLLTRLHDWTNTPPGALVTRKDPAEYLARLRAFARDGADAVPWPAAAAAAPADAHA